MSYPVIEISTIIMHEGKVLLGRPTGGKWETPIDTIEPFEHMKDAIIRVVVEQSGLTIEPQTTLFISETVKPESEHCIHIFLYSLYKDGTLSPAGTWDEAIWADVRELGNYQDEMSEVTADALYKFSMVLRQKAAQG